MPKQFFSRHRGKLLFLWGTLVALAAPAILRAAVTFTYTPKAGDVISLSGINSNLALLNNAKLDKNNYRIVSADFPPPAYQNFSEGAVTCPAGMLVTGGGCFNNSFGNIPNIQNSPNPFTANSWYCRYRNDTLGDVSNVQTTAYAICVGP